jgi:PIN domain nuclease of toxin-antitoxin system
MTTLDAFAVIALLKGEPASGEVQSLIEQGGAALTTIGVAEVLDHLVRVVGVDPEDAVLDIAQLGLDSSTVLTEIHAIQAALLRARHYQRRSCAVSLADCIAGETARRTGRPIATSDPHLLDVCHEEDIPLVALQDSRGNRWIPGS